MICPTYYKPIPDDSIFCPECGAPVATPEPAAGAAVDSAGATTSVPASSAAAAEVLTAVVKPLAPEAVGAATAVATDAAESAAPATNATVDAAADATAPEAVKVNSADANAQEAAESPIASEAKADPEPSVTSAPTVPPQPSRGYAQAGIFGGVLCLIVAAAGFMLSGGSVESSSFGGDFYTYAYKGIAAISKEIELLNRLVCAALGAFGIFMICHFGHKLPPKTQE